MFFTFKKWTALYILCLILLFAGLSLIAIRGKAVQASAPAATEPGGVVLVLDPGHGGEDGGAVAADGTVESQINLAIALQIEEIAQLLGMDTEMTRREDVSIHDAGSETLRQKKVSDLKNRVALINSVSGGILLSIHQNSMPTAPSVHGAQAFYNGTDGSEALAQDIQTALNSLINEETAPKSPKRIGESIYLMKNVTVPAVLVECGFLSNPQETARLQTSIYQTRLAMTILSGVMAHFNAPARHMPAA